MTRGFAKKPKLIVLLVRLVYVILQGKFSMLFTLFLDMYFGYKSDKFTADQINILKIIGLIMKANIKIHWNLRQTQCFEPVRHVGILRFIIANITPNI